MTRRLYPSLDALLASVPPPLSPILLSSDEDEQPAANSSRATPFFTPTGVQRRLTTDIEMIDLVSPDASPTRNTTTTTTATTFTYVPRTLQFHNQRRLSILPTFPLGLVEHQQQQAPSLLPSLLLANVPVSYLSNSDAQHRQTDRYPTRFTIDKRASSSTSMMLQYYEKFYASLCTRLRVDLSILDYNCTRLQHALRLCRDARHRTLGQQHARSMSNSTWTLDEKEYPLLLEFYLQMDVDLFYMKTCAFRQAQPRSDEEGLFCRELPICSYTMKPCQQCDLCHPPLTVCARQQPPVIFYRYERHRFVNGYEAILNAPAICSTSNIIYVLTCPCEQYDYIGETGSTLQQRLARHRQLGNLILHECLIGEQHRRRLQQQQQQQQPPLNERGDEVSTKSRMRLYQRYASMMDFTKQSDRNDPMVEARLRCIPTPPIGYRFSCRQRAQQYDYFIKGRDKQQPDVRLDLYNAKIIALLPPQVSETFRQVVHAFFVTHAETKLNKLGHIFDDPLSLNLESGLWCSQLVRRPCHAPLVPE
jgi:hypothetical protein